MLLLNITSEKRYGLRAVLLLALVAGIFLLSGITLFSQPTEKDEYIESLIKKAEEKKLYNQPYWHTIIHYKKTFTGNYESLVDDPAFFFASNGKTDPSSEMEETIRAFFREKEEEKTHATAKFSARYKWLREKLEIDTDKIPYNGDKDFLSQYYENVNPSKAVVVFPAGYMNSPASMYGHTFIIIESDSGSRLMASSVNYAASTDDLFGPLFAVRGLFGAYKGYYSFLPYFQKIKEYSDGEMRDMWEYELNLTPDELEKMIRHIVEMEDIYSDYYFIDENCSYNLLFLIEAARPETAITDSFGIGVEPINTIRETEKKGLISKRIYRPSVYSKMKYLRSLLTDKEEKLVRDVCRGKRDINAIEEMDPPETKKIIMYDLAADYIKFLAIKREITEDEYKSRFMSILINRNKLGKHDTLKDMPVPPAPEESHKSRRITPESGYGLKGWYSQLSYRQSVHHLMDPDEGYNLNSQIIFGNISARYYYDEKKPILQRFDIIDIISLPQSDAFFTSPCYEFKTGFIQNTVNEEDLLSYWIKGASGLSTLLGEHVQVYLLGGMKFYFAPEYSGNTDFHAGGETGMLVALGPWKGHFYGNYYYVPAGFERHTAAAGISQRLKITTNVSVMADYSYNLNMDNTWHEASLNFNFYF